MFQKQTLKPILRCTHQQPCTNRLCQAPRWNFRAGVVLRGRNPKRGPKLARGMSVV